jgi:hypothetical protein
MGPLGRWAAGFVALAWSVAAGCGDVDATDEPFVGTVRYEDPAGAFTLRLLQPPWLPALTIEGRTFFVVPPSDATISTDPSIVLGEALYSLQIDPPGGTAPADAMQAVKAGLPTTAVAVEDAPVRTASGATGMELAWQMGFDYHLDAFLADSGTPTFRLHFTAKRDIGGDPMVAQMIASFDPQ